jgi:hypothetical protein
MGKVDLDRTYCYHAPFGTQTERYIKLREAGKALALAITELAPPSREASVALTNVQQAVMWANAAIAINETPVVAESTPTNQESA